MFDLKELLKVQQKLQLSFAGNVNALLQNGASFKAMSGCSGSCAGSCEGSCSHSCYGNKMPGSCTFK